MVTKLSFLPKKNELRKILHYSTFPSLFKLLYNGAIQFCALPSVCIYVPKVEWYHDDDKKGAKFCDDEGIVVENALNPFCRFFLINLFSSHPFLVRQTKNLAPLH
jgi:hypothetical protein